MISVPTFKNDRIRDFVKIRSGSEQKFLIRLGYTLYNVEFSVECMILILDGTSEIGSHVKSIILLSNLNYFVSRRNPML